MLNLSAASHRKSAEVAQRSAGPKKMPTASAANNNTSSGYWMSISASVFVDVCVCVAANTFFTTLC